jgi:hypothetical protein
MAVSFGGSRFLAGERLRLAGPGNDIAMPGRNGVYSAQPTDSPDQRERWFVPGSWRLSGGGNDVSPFDWQFSIPPLVEITNGEEIQRLQVDADPVFRWDGSRYREDDVVVVRFPLRGMVECTTDARAGELTVPRSLLEPSPDLLQVIPTLFVERRATSPLVFPLQLANGKSAVGIVTRTVSRPYDWFIRSVP